MRRVTLARSVWVVFGVSLPLTRPSRPQSAQYDITVFWLERFTLCISYLLETLSKEEMSEVNDSVRKGSSGAAILHLQDDLVTRPG